MRGFFRLPDGGIGGEWPEPGDPDGPPDERWMPPGVPLEDTTPDAGIAECAEGWQRAPDGECSPGLRTDCPEGSRPLPGASCTHTAPLDCPPRDYADPGAEAVGMPVVHARAGADARVADGTAERPYATIAEGLARTGAGGWLLVAAGEYRERVSLSDGLSRHVLGVCAARAVIVGLGPVGMDGEAVAVRGAGTSLDLRDVTVTGVGRGLAVGGGAALRLTRVAAAGNHEHGIVAGGANTRLEVVDSVVRGTVPAPGNANSRGVTAQGGAQVFARGLAIVENVDVGLRALGVGTGGELLGCTVRGNLPLPGLGRGLGPEVLDHASLRAERSVVAGNGDAGASASGGATLHIVESLVRGNAGWGVTATDVGTVAELRTSDVRQTRSRSSLAPGYGILARAGAHVLVTGGLVAENPAGGVRAEGAGTEVTLSGSVVRDSTGGGENRLGHGLDVLARASLHLADSVIAHNAEVGILAQDPGTRVNVERSAVRDTQPRGEEHGEGIQAAAGAEVSVARSRVAGNASVGVSAIEEGTAVEVRGSVVQGTRPAHLGGPAQGLRAGPGATLRATGVLLSDNIYAGVACVGGGARVELTGCAVRGTRTGALSEIAVGLIALDGGSLLATRVAVTESERQGALALGAGTELELTRSLVRGDRSDRGAGASRGVTVGARARLRATGVVIEDASDVGVFTYDGGTRVELAVGW